MRIDGRAPDALRSIEIERKVNRYAEGSSLIRWGHTIVHCTASIEDKVPSFMRGSGSGWISAEYAMLPRATHSRSQRDVQRGRINGRGSEIQRLIGRSLRAAADLDAIGERTVWIDCDVLQADGGTRTASITGAFVCLVDALRNVQSGTPDGGLPLSAQVAALSLGKIGGTLMLDLCYEEDSNADVDFNVVMNSADEFVELQGTGEGGFFTPAELNDLLRLAQSGLSRIFALQRAALDLTPVEEAFFDELGSR